MSWSIRVKNGDLALGASRLDTVTAQSKLLQDLSHWFREHMGTDRLHPEHGSLLDGGLEDGEFFPGVIGEVGTAPNVAFIESEIRRIVGEYKTQQSERAKDDRLRYNKATLTAGELLLSLDDVQMNQQLDRIIVRLFITTGIGQTTLDLALPST